MLYKIVVFIHGKYQCSGVSYNCANSMLYRSCCVQSLGMLIDIRHQYTMNKYVLFL